MTPTDLETTGVIGCARCGQHHLEVHWQPLTRPVEDTDGTHWTHWTPCPTNGEPILMRSDEQGRTHE